MEKEPKKFQLGAIDSLLNNNIPHTVKGFKPVVRQGSEISKFECDTIDNMNKENLVPGKPARSKKKLCEKKSNNQNLVTQSCTQTQISNVTKSQECIDLNNNVRVVLDHQGNEIVDDIKTESGGFGETGSILQDSNSNIDTVNAGEVRNGKGCDESTGFEKVVDKVEGEQVKREGPALEDIKLTISDEFVRQIDDSSLYCSLCDRRVAKPVLSLHINGFKHSKLKQETDKVEKENSLDKNLIQNDLMQGDLKTETKPNISPKESKKEKDKFTRKYTREELLKLQGVPASKCVPQGLDKEYFVDGIWSATEYRNRTSSATNLTNSANVNNIKKRPAETCKDSTKEESFQWKRRRIEDDKSSTSQQDFAYRQNQERKARIYRSFLKSLQSNRYHFSRPSLPNRPYPFHNFVPCNQFTSNRLPPTDQPPFAINSKYSWRSNSSDSSLKTQDLRGVTVDTNSDTGQGNKFATVNNESGKKNMWPKASVAVPVTEATTNSKTITGNNREAKVQSSPSAEKRLEGEVITDKGLSATCSIDFNAKDRDNKVTNIREGKTKTDDKSKERVENTLNDLTVDSSVKNAVNIDNKIEHSIENNKMSLPDDVSRNKLEELKSTQKHVGFLGIVVNPEPEPENVGSAIVKDTSPIYPQSKVGSDREIVQSSSKIQNKDSTVPLCSPKSLPKEEGDVGTSNNLATNNIVDNNAQNESNGKHTKPVSSTYQQQGCENKSEKQGHTINNQIQATDNEASKDLNGSAAFPSSQQKSISNVVDVDLETSHEVIYIDGDDSINIGRHDNDLKEKRRNKCETDTEIVVIETDDDMEDKNQNKKGGTLYCPGCKTNVKGDCFRGHFRRRRRRMKRKLRDEFGIRDTKGNKISKYENVNVKNGHKKDSTVIHIHEEGSGKINEESFFDASVIIIDSEHYQEHQKKATIDDPAETISTVSMQHTSSTGLRNYTEGSLFKAGGPVAKSCNSNKKTVSTGNEKADNKCEGLENSCDLSEGFDGIIEGIEFYHTKPCAVAVTIAIPEHNNPMINYSKMLVKPGCYNLKQIQWETSCYIELKNKMSEKGQAGKKKDSYILIKSYQKVEQAFLHLSLAIKKIKALMNTIKENAGVYNRYEELDTYNMLGNL